MTETLMERPGLRIIAGPGSDDGPALVAAAIPVAPPRSWFDKSTVPKKSPLTFTADGRVYGRVAPRDVDHVGMPNRPTRAPYSQCDHAWFLTGQVRCDDGTTVDTGPITMLTGHPDQYAGSTAAAAHYDHTGTAIADVVVWDEPDGVYCTGAARPGVTPEEMRMAMGSTPSGDWRPIKADGFWGQELTGALLVNRGGFPSRRDLALAASASLALTASSSPESTEGARAWLVDWDNAPRIVITASSTSTSPQPDDQDATENTMTEQITDTVETPAPVFGKDDVVRIPEGATLGMVASVDDGRAIVQVEVPVTDLQDAGQEGRLALSASARERLLDSHLAKALTRIEEMEGRMTSLVASAEEKQRGAQALNVLGGIPE